MEGEDELGDGGVSKHDYNVLYCGIYTSQFVHAIAEEYNLIYEYGDVVQYNITDHCYIEQSCCKVLLSCSLSTA